MTGGVGVRDQSQADGLLALNLPELKEDDP